MTAANPFHIDLLIDYLGTSGDITTPTQNSKVGTNGLFLTAVLDTAELKLQLKPKGSDEFYEQPAGIFVEADLVDGKIWVNTALAEGDVRAVLTNTSASTVITEFILRPVTEGEIDF